MDFNFTAEQNMLKISARDFLKKECPTALVREMLDDEMGYPRDLWKKIADLGWMGITLPPEYGGTGNKFLDLVILQEEMGRFLIPSPFLSTILAGRAVSATGRDDQKRAVLPGVSDGSLIMALAFTEPSGSWDASGITVRAVRDGEDFVIDGTKLFIPYAHAADLFLCATRTGKESDNEDGITLFLINPKTAGVRTGPLKTITGEKLCEVIFDRIRVPESDILGEVNRGWPIMEDIITEGAVAECGATIGGARWVLETAVDYAKNRRQFGVPIGSFQAIQHKCADIFTAVDGATFITYHAAWAVSEKDPGRTMAASEAKAFCSDVYNRITNEGIQILGGMGYTLEHDMQLYFRRARASELAFGDSHFHREKLLRLLDF